MRLLALSLVLAACTSPAPGEDGAGIPTPAPDAGGTEVSTPDPTPTPGADGAGVPTPRMAVGDPDPVTPHPDGADGTGRVLNGSDMTTDELDGCTVYTEPGATEAIATVVRHADGERLVIDTMPYTRVMGADTCPAPGPDAITVQGENGRVGIFYGRSSRATTSLMTIEPTQQGGLLSVFDEADGALILSASTWDGDTSVTLAAPNVLVYDVYHGSPEDAGVECPSDPDGEPPFVVERTRLDLDARTTDTDGLRCIQ